MPGSTFDFKQFSIKQDKCAMKVGTDAVLLGAWVTCGKAEYILDIGTGTGVIALMIAQKCDSFIEAIDIDAPAVQQAKENIASSKWSDRIIVRHKSLQDFAGSSHLKFDLIVSNPPFFTDSSKAAGSERTLARHTDLLSFGDLLKGVKKLLVSEGRFCLILPVNEAQLLREIAEPMGLYLSKLTRVRTREDKQTEKRWLMQFEPNPKSFSENSIVIEKDSRHNYTDEYKELTKDYYLQF